jgi:hypothetical protein
LAVVFIHRKLRRRRSITCAKRNLQKFSGTNILTISGSGRAAVGGKFY